MMRILLAATAFVFFSCNNKKPSPATAPRVKLVAESADSSENFFPVTEYLKGEIANISVAGITPIDKIKEGNKVDSSWLKEKDYDHAFADFLSPEIDSVKQKSIFSQKKFLDQSLNAYTFTYDPLNEKADSFAFQHWDVYIDPKSNKVTRVYLMKKAGDKELELTWQSGKWCRIVTINSKDEIEKDEKISWSYEKK